MRTYTYRLLCLIQIVFHLKTMEISIIENIKYCIN